jgi:hypothetical protein
MNLVWSDLDIRGPPHVRLPPDDVFEQEEPGGVSDMSWPTTTSHTYVRSDSSALVSPIRSKSTFR